jgi:hypothetical protein
VSLTGLLKAKGPVRDWFANTFPETQRVCSDANRELRAGGTDAPCAIPLTPGADPALAGTAVGYLLSGHLRAHALDETVATRAAQLLDGPLRGQGKFPPRLVERVVVHRIRELRPWERTSLDDERWEWLCQLVCVLARFEQYFRAGPRVLPHLAPPLAQHSDNLGELAAALVKAPTLQDVSALGRATVEDHGRLCNASALFIGPTFVQSIALAGADADLIYDETLVDLKSSSQARVLGREELWQLLGYLFADTDNSYGITRVGVAALRHRRSILWSAEELMRSLGADPAVTLARWRDEFARLLQSLLAEQHAARRAQRLQDKRRDREGAVA